MSEIDNTLNERQAVYGPFECQAEIEQELRAVVSNHSGRLYAHHSVALGMICHKIARILNGDPNHRDSWHDIAGYAQCVVNILDKGADLG